MARSAQPKTSRITGQCSQCINPSVKGRSRCRKHLNTANALARRRNAERKAHGMCIRCPNVAEKGHVLCGDCLEGLRGRETNVEQKQERELNKLKARKVAGFCRWCNEPIYEGRNLCKKHLESQRKKVRNYRAERRAAGLCWRCDDPARPGGVLCQRHRDEVTEKERVKSISGTRLPPAGKVAQKIDTPPVVGSNDARRGKVAASEPMMPVVEHGYGVDSPTIADIVDLDGVKFASR